jgi:EAL domain-containing protein (putative c-di-GMP-specific phosphodiesterase class I)
VETLVKHADTAMYHAKSEGLNRFQFFDSSMNDAMLRKLTLESRLGEALERDELRLHYQPKVCLQSREITGMEGLLRWTHPELGIVSPKEIIPITEESGLILALGEWVVRTACKQIRLWLDAGYDTMRVAVNVSTRQIINYDLCDMVARALRENDLDPSVLELEITETAILGDEEASAITLRDLRSMGVRIALDDFGTGYSSMSYVRRFPLDVLKIDQCFVRDIEFDPAAAGIVQAVVTMAHSLGLKVIAEGVDSEAIARSLSECGCDEMQGFLISEALPPEDLGRFLSLCPAPRAAEL